MRLGKTSITLGASIMALATFAANGASAGYFFYGGYRSFDGNFYPYRAPQPNQGLPKARSRATNRDVRMAPSIGGRGISGGMGADRSNGGMGRR